MSEKALYVLAGYDDVTEMYLTNIQNTLYECGFTGTQTRNIPQHITLGSFSTEKENELVDLLRELSSRVSSFEITFNHVGVFNGSRVLFVAPDSNSQLLNLKELFGDSYNWTPHTTMLIDDPEIIYRALPIVMDMFKSFKGKITALHLYEFFPARHIISVYFE